MIGACSVVISSPPPRDVGLPESLIVIRRENRGIRSPWEVASQPNAL
jgi:hypothetical protein